MEVVSAAKARTFRHGHTAIVHDYETPNEQISGATAVIEGRYPETGFVMNQKVQEMVFVVAGNGSIETPQGKHSLTAGDLVLLQPNEAFAWSGDLTLFIATTPRFSPEQYVTVPA